MGQACIKGPKSAGEQKSAASPSGHSLENTAAKQREVSLPEGPDSTNLPEAKESYDAADFQARSAQVRDPLEPINITATGNGHLPAGVLAGTIPSTSTSAPVEQSVRRVVSGGSSYSEAETDAGSATSDVELLRNYTQLAEMLTFSPYPLMLIDIELETQPIVFASQALLKLLDLLDDELLDRPWREVLKTPFRHEAHSDVQGRIQEAFTTGCEFRETAACLSSNQDLMTLQLLFLPVAKDPESGITHYISIIVAHNEGKNGAKDPDATTPVPLPKLPVNLDDVPTARYVSVTMKALPKEQLLGLTSASAAAGSPRQAGSPKIRRPSTLGLAVAGFPSSAPEPEPQAGPPKGGAALLGRGRKNGKGKVVKQKSRFATEAGAAEDAPDDSPTGDQGWAADDGPLGNLRYDSALMGAISSQKGQKVPTNRVPRTKEEVWLHRLRDMLTTEIGSSDTIAKPEALALANASSE